MMIGFLFHIFGGLALMLGPLLIYNKLILLLQNEGWLKILWYMHPYPILDDVVCCW